MTKQIEALDDADLVLVTGGAVDTVAMYGRLFVMPGAAASQPTTSNYLTDLLARLSAMAHRR